MALYGRIFPVRHFRIQLYVMAGVLVGWCVGSIFACAFRCVPFNMLWNLSQPGRCIDFDALFRAGGTVSIVHDVLTLLLPLQIVVKLQMKRNKKWLVMLTFMMGGL